MLNTKLFRAKYHQDSTRPLSPHLSIYKPQLTSTLSIFHRITGSVLTLVILFSIIGLKLYTYYATCSILSNSLSIIQKELDWAVSSVYFLTLFSLYYHTCNGIRHLLWDFGYGLNLKSIYQTGYAVLIASFLLTTLTWLIPSLY